MKQQMRTLASGGLDIDELERRLELAAAATQARTWCTPDGPDCPTACGMDCIGHCQKLVQPDD